MITEHSLPPQFDGILDTNEQVLWKGHPHLMPFLATGIPFLCLGLFWGLMDLQFIKAATHGAQNAKQNMPPEMIRDLDLRDIFHIEDEAAFSGIFLLRQTLEEEGVIMRLITIVLCQIFVVTLLFANNTQANEKRQKTQQQKSGELISYNELYIKAKAHTYKPGKRYRVLAGVIQAYDSLFPPDCRGNCGDKIISFCRVSPDKNYPEGEAQRISSL